MGLKHSMNMEYGIKACVIQNGIISEYFNPETGNPISIYLFFVQETFKKY